MSPSWLNFLEETGAVFDPGRKEVLHFGNPAVELVTAQTATVLAPLLHLGLIEGIGKDARSFLHSQLTSDINHLEINQAQHSAWCSAKGRMLASFLTWRNGEAYQLALAAELVEAIMKRMQMFVLRSQVKFANFSDSHILLGLAGPEAADALTAANLPTPAQPLGAVAAANNNVIRLDSERFVVAAPWEVAGALWKDISAVARPVGMPVWRWLDIRAGLPLVTEATREEFVPQMADFEKIGGVSFHKGCYPGQEIVARTQYLGKVKRHLYRLRSNAGLQAGDDLHSPLNPEQAIGKVVSAAPSPAGGFEALAVVQSNFSGDLRLGALEGPPVEADPVHPA